MCVELINGLYVEREPSPNMNHDLKKNRPREWLIIEEL
jgi:hypothetical protein